MALYLSVLVVSKDYKLLNKMLRSLDEAISLKPEDIEIICSWNGSKKDESLIRNESKFSFNIVSRDSYHFARNMNKLANYSKGENLLFINDDVILDKKSVINGLECFSIGNNVGLVGGRLRYPNNSLQHAGIAFDEKDYPYHILQSKIYAQDNLISNIIQPVPAVTGALVLIKRNIF